MGIVCDLSFVTILSPGRCLINAKNPSVARLADAMSSLPADATLDIRVDGDKILVSASGVKWKCVLPSEDPDLYPSIPGAETGRPFASVAGADLKRAIKRTGYAQDVTSTRYALGGSLAERDTERSTMILVATDGRRLVKVELPAEFEPADESSTPAVPSASPVLSKRFLDLVSGLIDPDAVVGLRLDSNRAVIASQQGWSLYGRLVEGRFPRYQDVRPSDHDAVVRATITTADLLGAVGRVAAIACGEESRGLDLTWNEGGLDISGQSADHGQSDGWVAADYRAVADGLREVPEAGVGVTMDARFLVETLSAAAPETMEFRVIDHKNAVLLVGDDGALEVTIMPLTRDR